MFTQLTQKLAPAICRSTTSATAMMSSLSLTSRPLILTARTPLNLAAKDVARRSFGASSLISQSSSLLSTSVLRTLSLPKVASLPSSSSGVFRANFLVSNSWPVTTTTTSSCGLQQVRGFASQKHKRVIKQSKGFRGRANRCYRVAIRRLEKSWQYAYRDRKVKKREFRKLWITRVNAGVRQQGLSYSKFIALQTKSGVILDRKILSELAMYEPFSFKAVVDVVKKMSAESGV